MDKPSILNLLVGYCAGKGGLDRVERRRLERYFRTLPDQLELHDKAEPSERARPSNFLTPWKEPNFGVIFRYRRTSPDAEKHQPYQGRFDSFSSSDRAVVLEADPSTPESQIASAAPPKQLKFTIPPVWSTEHTVSFPTIVLPQLVVSHSQETQLHSIIRDTEQHNLAHKSSRSQQIKTATSRDDAHTGLHNNPISNGTNHSNAESTPSEPNTKSDGEVEVTRRVFPPVSEQTAIERLLYHEYCVRGLLRTEVPAKEGGKVDMRDRLQDDSAVVSDATLGHVRNRQPGGFSSEVTTEKQKSRDMFVQQSQIERSVRHTTTMRYYARQGSARVVNRPLRRPTRTRQTSPSLQTVLKVAEEQYANRITSTKVGVAVRNGDRLVESEEWNPAWIVEEPQKE